MIALSVNLNKVALIRNARGGNVPDLIRFAQDCVAFGADGITVHPRPDERHVRRSDVGELVGNIPVELNVEGYPSEAFLQLMERTRPAQCTLVPDPPEALTSNAGWDTVRHYDFLVPIIRRLKDLGIRTSIFVEPVSEVIRQAAAIGTDRVELYTEPYASAYAQGDKLQVEPYIQAAREARSLGLGINAGHDLNLQNLSFLATQIPFLDEVSIGHALISDALYMGIEETIKAYQRCLGKG